MEKRLLEVLENRGGNYILPFFWQHGETRELLEEGMEKIHDSGIGAVCVESRPHPDFLGDKWWQDMDIIMEKAKKLGMRVWVLDDAHFPSGFCNGRIGEDSPYGKTYLTHYNIDVAGPLRGNAFMVRLEPGERLIGVTLSRRDREKSFFQTQVLEVTERVRDGKLYLDIPEGTWAVTVIKTTRKGTGRKGYINSIDREAVRYFIHTVYEAHYARYAADFGGIFAGFFSDEPEIGNCLGEYVYDSFIGQPTMKLPWSEELERRLREQWGEHFVPNLLAMWVNTDESPQENRTGLLRRQFMEQVSDLYGTNFCGQIGDWCRAHRVEYIGHVIEDGGTHAHLGLGTGHFFKALWGQDMSGIDVVLQQIRPQLDDFPFYSIGGTGFYHGEFFHYGLAKLGVSLGHLDPKKHGRTMCEVFGAYGWAEGLKLMKWLLDHMLVNGVNYFVPHAFTMKEFPDPDCPPHFYARGRNPQFPYFKYLMEYTNRVSHLLNGGRHVPAVALLYTAEQEWMGEVRKFEKDAKELAGGQIDFEVIPEELLLKAKLREGRLELGGEYVSGLVIPGSKCISEALAEKCSEFSRKDFPIVITERLPDVLGEDGRLRPLQETVCFVPGERLAGFLRERGLCELSTSEYQPWLRYYHYVQPEGEFYLFFTECVTDGIKTRLTLPSGESEEWWYDPWLNRLSPCVRKEDGTVELVLSPYEMKILYQGQVDREKLQDRTDIENRPELSQNVKPMESCAISDTAWTLKTQVSGEVEWRPEPAVSEAGKEGTSVLGDLNAHSRKPYFSGTMCYTAKITYEGQQGAPALLDLGEVYESAEVRINGQQAGVRVAPPYRFDVTGLMRPGENTVEVLVINTLAAMLRDYMSMTLPLEPAGLLGPVTLYFR